MNRKRMNFLQVTLTKYMLFLIVIYKTQRRNQNTHIDLALDLETLLTWVLNLMCIVSSLVNASWQQWLQKILNYAFQSKNLILE